MSRKYLDKTDVCQMCGNSIQKRRTIQKQKWITIFSTLCLNSDRVRPIWIDKMTENEKYTKFVKTNLKMYLWVFTKFLHNKAKSKRFDSKHSFISRNFCRKNKGINACFVFTEFSQKKNNDSIQIILWFHGILVKWKNWRFNTFIFKWNRGLRE